MKKDLLALAAGALLPLGLAPFHFASIGFFSIAILSFTLHGEVFRRALWRAWLFGLGQFGVGVSWVYISIHDYGYTSAPIAALFTTLLVIPFALFPVLQLYVWQRLFPKPSITRYLFGFPGTAVFIEVLRSIIWVGFPWILVGYTQITNPMLRGFAPLVGVYGLTFLVYFSVGLAAVLLLYPSQRRTSIFGFLMLFGTGLCLNWQTWTQAQGSTLAVAAVQGNIPQLQRWDNDYLTTILQTYHNLSTRYWDHHLIVWPESAIPIPSTMAEGYFDAIHTLAIAGSSALVTGIPWLDQNDHFFNSLEVFGLGEGRYFKRLLVPFGEYVPGGSYLRNVMQLFNLPMSDFHAGAASQPLLTALGIPIAGFICYEIAYPNLVLPTLPKAQLLLTVSNNAWFNRSLEPWHLLEMAQMRSLETGRDQVLATNNGRTAIIDAQGHITALAPAFQATVLEGTIQPRVGSTPLAWYGQNLVLLVIGILTLGASRLTSK